MNTGLVANITVSMALITIWIAESSETRMPNKLTSGSIKFSAAFVQANILRQPAQINNIVDRNNSTASVTNMQMQSISNQLETDTVTHSMTEDITGTQTTTMVIANNIVGNPSMTTEKVIIATPTLIMVEITEISTIVTTREIKIMIPIIQKVLRDILIGVVRDKFTMITFNQVEEIPTMIMIIIGQKATKTDTITDQTWTTNTSIIKVEARIIQITQDITENQVATGIEIN